VKRALSIAVGLFLWSCAGADAQVPVPLPGPTIPKAFARLFVGQCRANKIAILTPPFAPSPVPVDSIAQTCTNGIAFNASNGMLAVASGSVFGTSTVEVYHPPYSGASVPFATLKAGELADLRQIAWDGSGNLWVANDKVFKFQAPFSPSNPPVVGNALPTEAAGLAINAKAGLMFIGDLGGSKSCTATACHVYVVPAPYTGAAIATFTYANSTPTTIAVDQLGRLFVGFDSGDFGGLIKVYVPPYVTGQTAAFTLNPGGAIESLAFDSAQNLYAQLYDTGGVVVFNAPILGLTAEPSAVLGCLSGFPCAVKNWAGLGFGP
jgi:hypothetical protein